jgi:hypothetical protein
LLNHRRYHLVTTVEQNSSVTKSVPALKMVVNGPTSAGAMQALQAKLSNFAMSVHAGERRLPKSDARPGLEYLAFDLVMEHDLARR